MTAWITHALLDQYEGVAGELEQLPKETRPSADQWELLDGMMLDLHLIDHGYASEGYEKHIARQLRELCSDESVAERMRAIRF